MNRLEQASEEIEYSGRTWHKQQSQVAPAEIPGALLEERVHEESAEDAETRRNVLLRQLEILAEESQRKRRLTAQRPFKIILIALVAVLFLIYFKFAPAWYIGLLGPMAGLRHMSNEQRSASSTLVGLEDLRGIGPICDLLALDLGPSEREMIETYLIKMLPRLNSGNRDLVSSEELRQLHLRLRIPRNNYDLKLGLAALEALQKIGNEESVLAAQSLAAGLGVASAFPELREAAAEALPVIMECAERGQAAKTLLRGASPEREQPELLLRPVSGAPTEDHVEGLLRPSD